MNIEVSDIAKSIEKLRSHPDVLDKQNISGTYRHLGKTVSSSVYFPEDRSKIQLGDDAAAIPQQNNGHLLFASEGIVPHFLETDPWFAGYSAVMVNISDICAMGGLPIAVTDTIHTQDYEDSKEIWKGMLAASEAYGVPIVGGHTCYHSPNKALSVSITGRATDQLLTSFDARPGEALLLAIDQNASYYKDYPFWNASTTTSPEVLQKQIELPYRIANKKWSSSAKDVSMGGIIGTLCMLLYSSEVGAQIDLETMTKPGKIPWEKWLSSFPSYGYLITCQQNKVMDIQSVFSEYGINCDHIGHIITEKELIICHQKEKIKF